MTTRELGPADADAVMGLLEAAKSGCAFQRPAGEALWRRWKASASTILGTFDDAGALFSVRVLDGLEGRRIRLRAGCHRDPLVSPDGYSETMKRSLRGFVAWLRHREIDQVVVPLHPGMLEAFASVRPHLAGAVVDGAFEYRTDDLAAFAGTARR